MRRKHVKILDRLVTMYEIGDAFYACDAVERLGSKASHPTVVAWCVKRSPLFARATFNTTTNVYQWRRVA